MEVSDEDIELLRSLPRGIFNIPLKKSKVDPQTYRLLFRIDALHKAGLLQRDREFEGQQKFNLRLNLTDKGVLAIASHFRRA